jgi:ADP-L-glycero-D-manno-heptose 6-epimerase
VVNSLRQLENKPAFPLSELVAAGLIEYVPFPDALRDKYQSYTQADLSALRATGCDHTFASVQTGVAKYLTCLAQQG